jgi:transketolase
LEAMFVLLRVRPFGWERYVGITGRIIGMHTFGASAPLKALQKKFGLEPSQVVTAAKEQLAIGEAARVLRVDKIRDLRGA